MTEAARNQPSSTPTGMVFNIQRMSTEDGPGIRTTVFFKGCSLACAWCHNPESISALPQIQWMASRCIGCLSCLEACPHGALSAGPQGVAIDRALCQGCGACVAACPSTALELLGRPWTVEALVDEAAKDRAYFESSGGGVTASGGEAALQADFVAQFLARCQALGLHTALDTCGQVGPHALELVLPHVDLVLFDLKLHDAKRHARFTGADNRRILDNLRLVRDYLSAPGSTGRLWIRTPVIPDATDDQANIRSIGRFLAREMAPVLERWELCAFNNLCRDKYARLGLDWPYKDAPLLTAEAMEALADVARRSGVKPGVVWWSGATRTPRRDEQIPPRLTLIDGRDLTV